MTCFISIPNRITEDLAEETGWHIGDGSMNFYKNRGKLRGIYQLRGHIVDDREHYLRRVKPIFLSVYAINVNFREMPSTRVYGFQIWSDELVKFKNGLGLPLGKKTNVSIPPVFLKKGKHKVAVIRGIFDTDGGIYLEKKNNKLYPRIEIRTISQILANQILYILQELGFRATKHSELTNKKYNRNRTYVLSVRGNEMFDKWMKIIDPKNPKHEMKYFTYRKTFK